MKRFLGLSMILGAIIFAAGTPVFAGEVGFYDLNFIIHVPVPASTPVTFAPLFEGSGGGAFIPFGTFGIDPILVGQTFVSNLSNSGTDFTDAVTLLTNGTDDYVGGNITVSGFGPATLSAHESTELKLFPSGNSATPDFLGLTIDWMTLMFTEVSNPGDTLDLTVDYTVTFGNSPVPGAVPEPTTMLLLGSGLLSLWGARKKFKK